MTREQAIKTLLDKIKLDALLAAAKDQAKKRNQDYALKLFIKSVDSTDTDQNWFTALAAICIFQRRVAGELLQQASGTVLSIGKRKQLIDMIESGAKITKADAGRALDASETGISGSDNSTA